MLLKNRIAIIAGAGSARELGPDSIRANAVCPSLIDADITAGGLSAEEEAAILADVPLRRAGEALEVAGRRLFLASGLSRYVMGSEIDVNGGGHIR
jgi:NAD(P)-dependent dehydrogenase (short-subunit alcohol dehydrogenase family)